MARQSGSHPGSARCRWREIDREAQGWVGAAAGASRDACIRRIASWRGARAALERRRCGPRHDSVGQAKTDAGVRIVNVLPALRDELLEYKVRVQDGADGLVFATRIGRPLGATNVRRRVLRAAAERASAKLRENGLEPLPAGLTRRIRYVVRCLAAIRARRVPTIRDEPVRARHGDADTRALRPGDEPPRRRVSTTTDSRRRRTKEKEAAEPHLLYGHQA